MSLLYVREIRLVKLCSNPWFLVENASLTIISFQPLSFLVGYGRYLIIFVSILSGTLILINLSVDSLFQNKRICLLDKYTTYTIVDVP